MAVTVRECLELQLLELEMLLSMFPKKGEINLDEDSMRGVQRYLRNADGALPAQLGYSIAVDVGEAKEETADSTIQSRSLLRKTTASGLLFLEMLIMNSE
ncbi:RWD domain-containing protein 2A isoform A [Patagioenas fasciata monilis]|uniref:RWD domain-containing protein 2A isoform A n=1 Tax=Patagioenas fasciata monilis TaxID=372326 RepID=A0A1V4JMB7_PATFA|nr:RWD domain-containing protein 2A isoform A [Patagioenas fasciata monilis]